MNGTALLLLVFAGVVALVDWYAVDRDRRSLEYVAKPATTALLVACAAALDPVDRGQQVWFATALVFCLAGDVFLMLPRDAFVAGLASFLIGHLCFLAGFLARGLGEGWWVVTTAAIALVVPFIARPVVRGARRQAAALVAPVLVYIAVLAALAAVSGGTGSLIAIAGAFVFVASDSILAWNRFVESLPHARLWTMATYHAALALLVLSLV